MAYENITLEHGGDGVTRIVIDRPPMNAVSLGLLEDLLQALSIAARRDETRCILLTGQGTRAFSAGADLKSAQSDPGVGTRFREMGREVLDAIESHPKPVVAAIRGWCIGGGFAIAMACDLRIASDTAKFRTADAYIGVVPSWGMSLTRLAHFIGRNRCMDMLMLGEDMDAAAARELGLLTSVTPDDRFDEEVDRVVRRLASGAPIVFKAIKEGVRAQYWDLPARARELETHWSDTNAKSNDYQEGRKAFSEKRKPVFNGN